MPADTPTIAPVKVPRRGQKSRLVTLNDLDQRTSAARRVREVMAALESDLGGSDHLSTAQRILVQRIAVQAAIIENSEASWARGEAVDIGSYTTMVNALRRNLETIGLERRARDVNFTIDDLAREFQAARKADEAELVEADQ